MKKVQKSFVRKVMMAVLTLCLFVSLVGCGAASFDKAVMEESFVTSSSTAGSNGSGFHTNTKYEYAETETADEAATGESGKVDISAADRKLIKTVDMHVETQQYDQLLAAIDGQVKDLGGYIENMNTYNGSAYYNRNPIRNADMTIRIPKENLDTFLNKVSDIGNVVRRTDDVRDVTLAYVDLQSHRDALRTEQSRLLELLEKAETVEDIITIEERLSNVRYQLESMESQLRAYDNQVDYSTVYLSIEEVEILTPVAEETVWQRISGGFVESLDNVGEGFVEFGIWFVVNLPYLVVWAVLIAVFITILIWVIKRTGKPSRKMVKAATQITDTVLDMSQTLEKDGKNQRDE
jgi:hypothetical protein